MERPVKERLIGAAVLMAAAIILIPEMLSGPGHESGDQPAKAGASGEGSIKTYTIDLNQSPGAQPPTATAQPDNRAPPPEETPSEMPAPAAQVTQASPESPPVATPEAPAQRTPASPAPKPEPRTETPASPPRPEPKPEPAKPEPTKPEPRAVASEPAAPRSAVPTGKGWAVQLGSYSSEATAQRLANEWRAKGQSAFVMPVTSGGKTLYRVRIGPSKDRAAAEAALKLVKPSIANAAVVAHP